MSAGENDEPVSLQMPHHNPQTSDPFNDLPEGLEMYVCASSTIGVNDPAKSVKLQNIVVVLEGKREVSKIHDLSALPEHLVMVMNQSHTLFQNLLTTCTSSS